MLRCRLRLNSATNKPQPASARDSNPKRMEDRGKELKISAKMAHTTPSSATDQRGRNPATSMIGNNLEANK